MMRYPLYERFRTWQGEGVHMGRRASFIRLFGCPVQCPWCDSAGTWHRDYIPERIERVEAEVLAEWAAAVPGEMVVITGGEPAIHDLGPLCDALHGRGLRVHLETSGAFGLRGDLDWVTVSPKEWKEPLPELVERADELKIIVDRPEVIEMWMERLGESLRTDSIWLHPEWSRRSDREVLEAINAAVLRDGRLRAGYQLHKLFRVDEADPGSRRAVPLGGDPERGF